MIASPDKLIFLGVGQVPRERRVTGAELAREARRSLERDVDEREAHVRVAGDERARDRAPDRARGAGDERVPHLSPMGWDCTRVSSANQRTKAGEVFVFHIAGPR